VARLPVLGSGLTEQMQRAAIIVSVQGSAWQGGGGGVRGGVLGRGGDV